VAAPGDLLLVDELLTDEEVALRDRVRAWSAETLRPGVNEAWEAARFRSELVPLAAELGIAGGPIEGYGCPGLSHVALGLANLELARVDGSFAVFLGAHSGLAMSAIARGGDEQTKERWLPRMAQLEAVGAFALTEPRHGSDAHLLEARAEGLRLTGRKRWIGNASLADVIVVWARDGEHVSGYLVERDAPGLQIEVIMGKTALRSVWQTNIALEGVEASAKLSCRFQDVLVPARPTIAWRALGHAIACFEAGLAHCKETVRFGRPLASFQLVQEKLATAAAEIASMQLLCWRLSHIVDDGKLEPAMASLAKLACARKARTIAADMRDLLGGDGILLANDVARHHADLEGVFTFEGTDHVQALVLGRELTGLNAFS